MDPSQKSSQRHFWDGPIPEVISEAPLGWIHPRSHPSGTSGIDSIPEDILQYYWDRSRLGILRQDEFHPTGIGSIPAAIPVAEFILDTILESILGCAARITRVQKTLNQTIVGPDDQIL